MEFTYLTAASTYFGAGCVQKHADAWALGARAFIVAGGKSGRLCGALSDVEKVLGARGIPHALFEGVENNPSVEQCALIADQARAFQADFIVAIGGGSPIDAAKAAAVMAAADISEDALFANAFSRALPIVAIPTTSGTGSEVTPWSVLTWKRVNNKRSFGNALTVPRVALLDPGYTRSLSKQITLDTAMDAFTHCFEGIMSLKATPVTDALAAEGLRRFAPCMRAIEEGKHDDVRDELMLVSLLGGMAIAHTGTTFLHAMGYPFTYYHGLTHGAANCRVLPACMPFLERAAPERAKYALSALGMSTQDVIAFVRRNYAFGPAPSEEEIARYAALTMLQGSVRSTPYPLSEQIVAELFREADKA